jgi:hypothetical protein
LRRATKRAVNPELVERVDGVLRLPHWGERRSGGKYGSRENYLGRGRPLLVGAIRSEPERPQQRRQASRARGTFLGNAALSAFVS